MEALGNVQAPARNQNVLDIPETLQLVCSFLDRPTLLAASRVSQAWRACCHPFLWSVVPATAWNNPYLLAHWKQHAPLIHHLSLAGQPSVSEHSLLLLMPPPPPPLLPLLQEVSEHCHELVSVDASRITVPGSSSGGNSTSRSMSITPLLCKVLLHNGGQLRSLRLSLQGRIPRDLVYALGNLRVLQELVLDHWTDFDEYSLQRILLDACPPSLVSLSLSDNDFLPFTLESLHNVPAAAAVVVDCPPPPPLLLQGGGTRSSRTALATGAAAWASSNPSSDHPKRASDPILTTTSNSVNDTTMTTDLSTRDHYSSLERDGGQDKRQQQQREPKRQHASYPNNINNSVDSSRRHPPKHTNMEMEMGNKVYPHLGSKFNLPSPSSGGGVLHNSPTSESTTCTKRIDSVATTTTNITSTTTTTQIRSLSIHRATFRQGFLLNLLRLCPRLERLSLLESRGFFPTATFPARLAQLCPRLRDFEFSSPAGSHGVDGGGMGRRGGGGGGGSGQQQPDLTDPFFAALLEQFPQTRHLVVGGSHAASGVVTSSSSGGTSSSSVSSTSPSSSSRPIGATGAPTGFSLKAWKQLLQTISPSSALHPHHQDHQHQLVHLTLDGVRGLPSKQLVQVLAQCTSLEHWSAKGLVLNARDVDDPSLRPWACRRLQVFVMDIEIYEMNVGVSFASFVSASSGSVANVSAAAAAAAVVGGEGGGGGRKEGREGGQGGGTGPVLDPRQEQQHGQQQQQQHEHNERESVEAVVRQRMYGQLALLGCLVHFGLGGGHGLRRQRHRQRQTQNEGDGVGRKSRQNDSLLLLQAEEGIVEEEPGIDLTRRSGVDKWLLVQQQPQHQQQHPQQSQRQQGRQTAWPFLEVLDLTRLCTNPRWHLDEGDEAWIANQFPRLRRILVAKKKKDWPSSSSSSSSVLSSMLATSATGAYTLRRQPSSQPQTPPLSPLVPLVEPPQKPDILLPWIRHHRPDIVIDEQS
ncbi:hypothetical protein DFQ26_006619 [Actinomortierella ambigua]|nr:hypothetical protein DFQ26_006619 [Actinomortierella ambigua]